MELWRNATTPSIYKALHNAAWPVREIIARPLTELPGNIFRLRTHAICRNKIFSGIGDHLRIRRMVNSFHTNNLVNHLLIVAVNVFYKIQLGASRPNNQNFLSAFQRFDNFVIEILILRCAT